MQNGGESADDHEIDVSVAQPLNQLIRIAHAAPPTCPLELEGQIQRLLMLDGALIAGQAEIAVDQGKVEACAFSLFDGAWGCRHGRTMAPPHPAPNCPPEAG